MKLIQMMRDGQTRELLELLPEFTEHAVAESDSGALSWLLAAMDLPTRPAELFGYGTVIGTGNAIVGWNLTEGGSP